MVQEKYFPCIITIKDVSCLEIFYFLNIYVILSAVWFDVVRAYPL